MTAATTIHLAREAKRTTSHISVLVAFSGLDSRAKLVAKCLADYYNDDLGLTWPSITRIAAYASCTPNTVRSQLIRLQEAGIISKVEVADRPTHLRRIKSHTWSINASALPPGQISLIDDLDDDTDAPACAATLTHRPAAAAPAAPAPTAAPELEWPELLDTTDTPAIVYADGYTPPAIFDVEGAILALEGCSLAAPEPKELLTPEGHNAPVPSAAPDHQPKASPQRALPAAIAHAQDTSPSGTTPKTWKAWLAMRSEHRGIHTAPTDADLAEIATAACAHYGPRPDALELALQACTQYRWLRFYGQWLKAKQQKQPSAPSAALSKPIELTPEARAAQALAARYGLDKTTRPDTTSPANRAARMAAMAAYNAKRIGGAA